MYLCHGADLPADMVHSSRLKDAGIHSLDSNPLPPKPPLSNIPPGTTSKNLLIHLDFFRRDTPELNLLGVGTRECGVQPLLEVMDLSILFPPYIRQLLFVCVRLC